MGCISSEERSRCIFEALGSGAISLGDGLSIVDLVREREREGGCDREAVGGEVGDEALNKLLCRWPSSSLILARKLEAAQSVEEELALIDCLESSASAESGGWSESERFEIVKKVWNLGAGHHRLRHFEAAQKIWSHSAAFVATLDGKERTKCNVLRARAIAFYEVGRMEDALRTLASSKSTEQNIKNTLLEIRCRFKLCDLQKVEALFHGIQSDPDFDANLWPILQREVARHSTTTSLLHIEILEKALSERHGVHRSLRADALSLKCLVNAVSAYLHSVRGTELEQAARSKLAQSLKLCLEVIPSVDPEGDRMSTDEIKWFALRLWDSAYVLILILVLMLTLF